MTLSGKRLDSGPLYLRLTAVVLGTVFVFGVVVVALHGLALGSATTNVRREALRLMANELVRDRELGLRHGRLPPPYEVVVLGPGGRAVEGDSPPRWLRIPDDAPDSESCGRWGGACYAVRAVPIPGGSGRLVVYHLPRLLVAPLTVALVGSVLVWIGLSAVAGVFLLKAMRRADEKRNWLLAGLAHDLGTPLTSIRGFAETLLCAPETSEASRRGLTIVYREALRMQGLVEDMLALSRVEAGRLELVRRPHDLRQLVLAAADRAKLAFGAPPTLTLPETPAVAEVDRDRLDQVLANLVDNAYRHGGGAGVRLTLAAHNDGFRVEVEDSGPGVAPALRARLFEPFARGDSGRGSGLGLAIAREIVVRHGGTLAISDPPGCRVTLDLPA